MDLTDRQLMGNNNTSSSIKLASSGTGNLTSSSQVKGRLELKQKIEFSSSVAASATKFNLVSRGATRAGDRFVTEIASVASDVNRRAAQLKQTKDSLSKERQYLYDLKQSFIEGDQEKTQQINEELKQLRLDRAQNSAQIKREQKISSSAGAFQLSEANSIRISIPELKLPDDARREIRALGDIEAQLADIGSEIDDLEIHSNAIEDARKSLSGALRSGREGVGQVDKAPLESLDLAQRSADQISSEVQHFTTEQLLRSVAANIDLSAVSEALKA